MQKKDQATKLAALEARIVGVSHHLQTALEEIEELRQRIVALELEQQRRERDNERG